MFKKVEICLTEPICDCEEQKLFWAISRNRKGQSGIVIGCNLCGTELRVDNSKFIASFHLDKPYPGKPKPKEKKPEAAAMDFRNRLTGLIPGEVSAFDAILHGGDHTVRDFGVSAARTWLEVLANYFSGIIKVMLH